MASRTARLAVATDHLQASDPQLRQVIQRVGPCRLRLRPDRFAALVQSIVSQQVSGHAARAIFGRLQESLRDELTPQRLSACTPDELRAVGLSRQKAAYLLDLAEKTRGGVVRLDRFGRLSDAAIVAELTQVKGIGVWTAQMLLIFSLGRLDVLPVDDFGIRSAVRVLYGLGEMPKKRDLEAIAAPWRPYASVASWYLWRSLDNGGAA